MMAWKDDADFGQKVAELCNTHYTRVLGKTGKPQENKEWTLMAAVVMTTDHQINVRSIPTSEADTQCQPIRDSGTEAYSLQVLALGTGSKCVGQSKISHLGMVIQDSHAEVIARRACIRFLYNELAKVFNGETSEVLQLASRGQCRLKDGVALHLFTSNTPCGDASIFPMESTIPVPLSCDIHSSSSRKNTDIQGEKRAYGGVSEDRGGGNKRTKVGGSSVDLTSGGSVPDVGDSEKSLVDNLSDGRQLGNEDTVHTPSDDDICKSPQVVHDVSKVTCDQTEHVCLTSRDSSRSVLKADQMVHKETTRGDTDGSVLKDNTRGSGDKSMVKDDMRKSLDQCFLSARTAPNDIYRTGAKCVPQGVQDPLGEGATYHVVGALRTKPGRGERTLSMSCSDKMAKWNVVGLQGALLSHFLVKPIYLESITLGRCPCSRDAMSRAVVERVTGIQDGRLPQGYTQHRPVFHCTSVKFQHGKPPLTGGRETHTPCSASIIWYHGNGPRGHSEVSVQGQRQGTTLKDRGQPRSRCCICKYELYVCFLKLINQLPKDQRPGSLEDIMADTYDDHKMAARDYQTAVSQFLAAVKTWQRTPREYNQFSATTDVTDSA